MIETLSRIHIVGIGGIGVSGLARILRHSGVTISGSDTTDSVILHDLRKLGIRIDLDHESRNVSKDCQALIYSEAVPADNPERFTANQLEIPEMSYPEAVAELTQGKKVIAVAGTNGKTTTTAMIAWILEQANFDPNVLVGSKVLSWDANARAGESNLFVVEADEYRRAFVKYEPDVAVITNIAADHLDYYKDLKDVQKAFGEFVHKVKPGGTLVYNAADKNTLEVIRNLSPDLSPHLGRGTSLPRRPPAERAGGEGLSERSKVGFRRQKFELKIPGEFNQENAAAAAAACEVLGVASEVIKSALESFPGTWRRFEKVGRIKNTDFISDYAHHPEGLKAVLKAAAEMYPPEKVLVVFQPHQHNRTKKLFGDFVKVLCESRVSHLILPEIFDVTGREEAPDQDVSSDDLVSELKKCTKQARYAVSLDDAEKQVRKQFVDFDAVLFLGAGDIYLVAEKFR